MTPKIQNDILNMEKDDKQLLLYEDGTEVIRYKVADQEHYRLRSQKKLYLSATRPQDLILIEHLDTLLESGAPHAVGCVNMEKSEKIGRESIIWYCHNGYDYPFKKSDDDFVEISKDEPIVKISSLSKLKSGDEEFYLAELVYHHPSGDIFADYTTTDTLTELAIENKVVYNQDMFDELLSISPEQEKTNAKMMLESIFKHDNHQLNLKLFDKLIDSIDWDNWEDDGEFYPVESVLYNNMLYLNGQEPEEWEEENVLDLVDLYFKTLGIEPVSTDHKKLTDWFSSIVEAGYGIENLADEKRRLELTKEHTSKLSTGNPLITLSDVHSFQLLQLGSKTVYVEREGDMLIMANDKSALVRARELLLRNKEVLGLEVALGTINEEKSKKLGEESIHWRCSPGFNADFYDGDSYAVAGGEIGDTTGLKWLNVIDTNGDKRYIANYTVTTDGVTVDGLVSSYSSLTEMVINLGIVYEGDKFRTMIASSMQENKPHQVPAHCCDDTPSPSA